MRIIGLTGGAGCGKSYVAGVIMRNFPILHISCDDISRRQMQPGQPVYESVIKAFGAEILGADGVLDRSALAAIVFNSEEKLKLLNSLTHPAVFEELKRIIALVESGEVMSMYLGYPVPYEAILIESAILRSAGLVPMCDDVWYVWASEEERIRRLMRSRGYSKERAVSTLASQDSEEEFGQIATGRIDNPDSGSENSIVATVRQLLA